MNRVDEGAQPEADPRRIKEQVEKMNAYANVYGLNDPVRENLRGRIHNRLRRSERDSRKLEQVRELDMLLDKNPEVARILELIEALQGEI